MQNTLRVTAVIVAIACGVSLAESATAPSRNSGVLHPTAAQEQPSTNLQIAPGSVIPVQLTKTVDAKKAKAGDEVVARVTQDIKTQSGEVMVPKDTKIVGHVTEAHARSKEQKESQLAIAFDHAVFKNESVQLPMSIQAAIGLQGNDNADSGPSEQVSPSTTGTMATSPMAGRSPVGGAGQPELQAPLPSPSDNPRAAPKSKRPPINAQTQGVIGISNVTLSTASNGTQGSVLSSEKSNVRLESGTMLLLKVGQ